MKKIIEINKMAPQVAEEAQISQFDSWNSCKDGRREPTPHTSIMVSVPLHYTYTITIIF